MTFYSVSGISTLNCLFPPSDIVPIQNFSTFKKDTQHVKEGLLWKRIPTVATSLVLKCI